MASELSLRIATQLDKRGFEDFKRESTGFVNNIRQANQSTQSLQESFSDLGKVLVGVFAASGLKSFIAAALETDRTASIIAGRFKTLGDAGVSSARDVESLVGSLAKVSIFSQTELLSALNATLRTTKSSGEAFRILSVAQTFAAATGKDVASATFEITRAQQGITRQLQISTGFTSAQIKQLNEEGKLLDAINIKFKDAAAAVGGTLSAELQRLGNRFKEVGESIGETLLPIVKSFVDVVKAIPTPLITGATAAGAFALVARGLAPLLAGINTAFIGIAVTAPSAAIGIGSVAASANVATTAMSRLTVAVRLLGNTLPFLVTAALFAGFSQLQKRFAEIDEAAAQLKLKFAGVPEVLLRNTKSLSTLEQQVEGTTNTIAFLNEELDKLGKVEQTDEVLKRTAAVNAEKERVTVEKRGLEERLDFRKKIEREGTKEEEKRFKELTKTKEEIRHTELANEIISLKTELSNTTKQGEELRAVQLRLSNDLIEIRKLGLDEIVKSHEEAAKKIVLIEEAIAARRPADTSKLGEDDQNKIIDSELRLRNRKLGIAETSKEDTIRAAKAEFDASLQTANDRVELERKISDAIKEERSKQLTIHQDFEEKIREFEFTGRKDLREEEKRKVNELAFQQESRIDKEEELTRATKKRLGLLEEQRIPAVVEVKTVEFSGDLTQQITEAFRKKLGDNFIIIKAKEPIPRPAKSGKS